MTDLTNVSAADGYQGVTHAGLAIVAADTGRVLMALRAMDPTDAPDVQRTWEFPGGAIHPSEEPIQGALREYEEEIGFTLAGGEVVDGWRADENGINPDGHYQGFVYLLPTEGEPPSEWFEPTLEVDAVAWFDQAAVADGAEKGVLRPELVGADEVWSLVWNAVSGNEGTMDPKQQDAENPAEDQAPAEEPEIDFSQVPVEPIPVHGVLAPEGTPSGDGRGFKDGALSQRPYRLPFRWQQQDIGAHDGAVTVGSVDRMMRKDGLIHWQGSLMPAPVTDEFVSLLEFFGRYGVSVDGVSGSVDQQASRADGMTWFDSVKAAGLTAVAIPAFAEAYVALGPHPDMPDIADPACEVMAASGDLIEFNRGKGWVTDPQATKRIHDYWTKKGEPGYAKIGWGTPGDFRRAKALIGEKIAKNSPDKMRFLNQIIAQWHHDALGYWPGDLGKPGNAPDTKENRRRAATHAAAERGITLAEDSLEWEAVLTASVGTLVDGPPAAYFDFHPDSGALVIEDPDENGFRRTYGYAAEWGVCHIGYGGRCVEAPSDPHGGEFRDFHLGRTRLADGGYLTTGVMTYKVDHRDAETILSETAEQQHFDNIAHAWASVRLGQDERGIWFSGVVLPGIPEEDITLIQATGQVSGEWRSGSLRAVQAVNVPGFPVMRSSAVVDEQTGEVLALAASAFGSAEEVNATVGSECNPVEPGSADDPVGEVALAVIERIEARATVKALADADALRQFERLRKEWS